MVTIADVAVRAGVGIATVSRVINDSPRVTDATRERVLAAIVDLDYRPSTSARALSRGRCQTLGVIVPFFTHASAVERLRGVVAALDGSRHDLVLFNVESPVHRDEHFAALTGRDRADGLLVMSLPPKPADLERLHGAGVPVVLVDARGIGVPMVVTNDVEGGRIATRHLVELGHERVAFIGDDRESGFGFTSSDKREQGYHEVMHAAGLEIDPSLVRYGHHERRRGPTVGRGPAHHRPPADGRVRLLGRPGHRCLGCGSLARPPGARGPLHRRLRRHRDGLLRRGSPRSASRCSTAAIRRPSCSSVPSRVTGT